MTMYYCEACKHVSAETAEVDHGGWEEFWGAKVWHTQMTTVCEACRSEDIYTLEEILENNWSVPKELEDYMEESFTP